MIKIHWKNVYFRTLKEKCHFSGWKSEHFEGVLQKHWKSLYEMNTRLKNAFCQKKQKSQKS